MLHRFGEGGREVYGWGLTEPSTTNSLNIYILNHIFISMVVTKARYVPGVMQTAALPEACPAMEHSSEEAGQALLGAERDTSPIEGVDLSDLAVSVTCVFLRRASL